MGDEAKSKGAHVILGPTINMQRSPLGGRGFESIGEDPVLAGLGASALVNGIQSTGIQATIKHFVCNDQEHKRNATQAILTDRALREIYLKPFQLAVRDSQPGSFMTAYNGVNGTYCSQNKWLLDGVLRSEWGWKGLIMSDWFGCYNTVDAALAGLDLEMPGPSRFRGEMLKFSVETDKVLEYELDERARTVLEFVKACLASGVKEGQEERAEDTPETAELLRRIGNEGLVLLKNEGDILPLKKDKKVRRERKKKTQQRKTSLKGVFDSLVVFVSFFFFWKTDMTYRQSLLARMRKSQPITAAAPPPWPPFTPSHLLMASPPS